jgi:beta-D-xylosidase 4
MDIGCDTYLSEANVITNAIADGAISEADVDRALTNLFSIRFRLGEFDPVENQPYRTIGPEVVCSADHQALARSAAAQGVVLLSNPSKTLPLSRSSIKSVAVVGPVANNSITNGGPNYNGIPCGGGPITMLQAFQQASNPSFTVNYAQGCDIQCASNSGFAAATAAAQSSDMTVVVVGIDQTIEDEGLDRINITLPGLQNSFIQTVCAAAQGKPCILIVMSGGSQDISAVLPSVSAAFYAGFLGGNGALAMVDMLFGDVVPAGRLTQTFFAANFINEVSMFEMNMAPGPSNFPPGNSPGRTYRFYTGKPIFPFGFGLSYTSFVVSSIAGPKTVSLDRVRGYLSDAVASAAIPELAAAFPPLPAPLLDPYSVNVTNTGTLDADYVVLGFLVPPGAGTNGIPLQELFAFERVFVPAGQTVTVNLIPSARDFTLVVPKEKKEGDKLGATRVAQGGSYTVRVGVRWEGVSEDEVKEMEVVVA